MHTRGPGHRRPARVPAGHRVLEAHRVGDVLDGDVAVLQTELVAVGRGLSLEDAVPEALAMAEARNARRDRITPRGVPSVPEVCTMASGRSSGGGTGGSWLAPPGASSDAASSGPSGASSGAAASGHMPGCRKMCDGMCSAWGAAGAISA